ncbi:MAG: hypothetical protein NUW21_01710 [Elusimicrobia bacterium]|nr:hypothetical protein [Elusimicrobiota bacterium]
MRDIITACPLRAQTVLEAAAELCHLLEDAAGALSPRSASSARQVGLLAVSGDLATLWARSEPSARPGVAVGVSPGGLDMGANPERKGRIVVLCASASREEGSALLDRVGALLTPALLRRLRGARDAEAVKKIFIDAIGPRR